MIPIQKSSNISIINKIPPAIPLLKPSKLFSQKFRSFFPLAHQPLTPKQKSTSSKPLGKSSKQFNIQYPFKKISDLLLKEQKIVFNILGQGYASQQQSFGFQYYGEKKNCNKQLHCIGRGNSNNSSLKFQSRFECGNLLLAYQYINNEYLLVIRPDYNTLSYCQWFYFEVKNQESTPKTIKLSIVNMTKSSSLFTQGMKIMTLTDSDSEWQRSGQNIHYGKNNFKKFGGLQSYYTLSWTISIQSKQKMLMAYSEPYSFTTLNKELDEFEQSKYVKRSILCRSLLENRIDIITISNGKSIKNKNVIIITARAHPVQTVGSFVMKGVIEFLISQSQQAKLLRDKFVFKLIPMINPDGVIHGNSRCTLYGVDPNRRWDKPTQNTLQVLELKKFILKHKQRLVMYIDLHGHSKKKNIFTYGCNDKNKPYASRQLPFTLSKLFDAFSFPDCNFKVNKQKQGTARVALWKTLRLPNIFTLESSFCSSQKSNNHFDQQGYKAMGETLCKAINICLSHTYLNEGTSSFFKQMKEQIIQQLQKQKQLLNVGMNQSSQSESEQQDLTIHKKIQEQEKEEIGIKINAHSSVYVIKPISKNTRNRLQNNLSQDILLNNRYYRNQNNSVFSKRISQNYLQKQSKTARSFVNYRATIEEHDEEINKISNKQRKRFIISSKNVIKQKDNKVELSRLFCPKKIINFDFALKDQDQGQKIIPLSRNKSKKNETQHNFLLKTLKKDGYESLIDQKLKMGQKTHYPNTRKRNILSRLQLFMRKFNQNKI